MAIYKGEEDEKSSVAFHKEQIITKMADVLSLYNEFREEHPDCRPDMCLEWCAKYKITIEEKG